jgi:hypothetical protein
MGMKAYTANEILINAIMVSQNDWTDTYEFVINDQMKVVECVRVESLAEGIIYPVKDYCQSLNKTLFELNHVRVNPRQDNQQIIEKLTIALSEIGVTVHNPPGPEMMSSTYRPLGEIAENVRFYLTESGQCVFLCPNAKLKLMDTCNSTNVTMMRPPAPKPE